MVCRVDQKRPLYDPLTTLGRDEQVYGTRGNVREYRKCFRGRDAYDTCDDDFRQTGGLHDTHDTAVERELYDNLASHAHVGFIGFNESSRCFIQETVCDDKQEDNQIHR